MLARNGYPPGVPCWVDLMQPDLDATMAFYGGLFGWTFEVRTPEAAPQRYAYARLDGLVVAGVGGPPLARRRSARLDHLRVGGRRSTRRPPWSRPTAGGWSRRPSTSPTRAGSAVCADPPGAAFGLWQAAENRGAQLVNAPGSWNFSELNAGDPGGPRAILPARVRVAVRPVRDERRPAGVDVAGRGLWRFPGRARPRDPQPAGGRPGAGRLRRCRRPPEPGPDRQCADAAAHWSVTFAVADADAAFGRATELGATVVTPLFDTHYTRMGTVEDPQGAVLTQTC